MDNWNPTALHISLNSGRAISQLPKLGKWRKKTLCVLFSRGSMDKGKPTALDISLNSERVFFEKTYISKFDGLMDSVPLPHLPKLWKCRKKTLCMLFSRESMDNWNPTVLAISLNSGMAIFEKKSIS